MDKDINKITEKQVIEALNTLTIFCAENNQYGFEAEVKKGDVKYIADFKIKETIN